MYKMKGQTWVEYFLTTTIFILATLYVFFQVTAVFPTHLREIQSQRVNIEAYQLTELLINDPGEPMNWDQLADANSIVRIGLSDQAQNKTNLISLNKLTKLNSICNSENGYSLVSSRLGVSDYTFLMRFTNSQTGGLLLSCAPSSASSPAIAANLTRVTAFSSQPQNGFGEFNFQLW